MKRICVLVLVSSFALLASQGAFASPGFRGAHSCVDSGPTPQTGVYRGGGFLGFGVFHFETGAHRSFTCPVTVEQSSMNPTTAYADYNDGSTVDDIVCTLFFQDDGTVTSLGARYSCSTVGGCTSANIAFVGTGTMSWADSIGAVSGDLAAAFLCKLGKADVGPTAMQLHRYELSH
jgi:hypothetical protein